MSLTKERARVAALSRSRPDNDPDLIEARRTLKANRLTQYVARTIATGPPLTSAQLDHIAVALRSAGVEAV